MAETGYPKFETMHYIDGYDPSSFVAPHSSLNRTSTWLGMGLILSSIVGFGVILFAFGANSVGSQSSWATYATIGVVIAAACIVVGAALVWHGRRNYREYVKRTGRHH